MSAFANLRNSSNLEKLSKAIEKLNTSETPTKEDNFWKPEVDKGGFCYALIRFLP